MYLNGLSKLDFGSTHDRSALVLVAQAIQDLNRYASSARYDGIRVELDERQTLWLKQSKYWEGTQSGYAPLDVDVLNEKEYSTLSGRSSDGLMAEPDYLGMTDQRAVDVAREILNGIGI